MTDVTNTLMFELMKRVHIEIGELKLDVQDIKRRMANAQESVVGIKNRLARHENRLDLIERRLTMQCAPAETQSPLDPHA